MVLAHGREVFRYGDAQSGRVFRGEKKRWAEWFSRRDGRYSGTAMRRVAALSAGKRSGGPSGSRAGTGGIPLRRCGRAAALSAGNTTFARVGRAQLLVRAGCRRGADAGLDATIRNQPDQRDQDKQGDSHPAVDERQQNRGRIQRERQIAFAITADGRREDRPWRFAGQDRAYENRKGDGR